MTRRALLIGGGIAGPVTAMALQRVSIDATVYEAYPSATKDIGVWLGLQTNGFDALGAIGADRPVAEIGFPTPTIALYSGTGKLLGELSTGAPRPGGIGGRSMTRSKLYRVLHDEALRRGVPIEYGKRLTGAQTVDGTVTATFADGSTASGDFLVGCDGIRSTVRRIIDPSAPDARYVPVLNVGGYADIVLPDAPVGRLTMVFGKRAFFGYLAAPDGQTWWFANPPRRQEPAPGELARVTDAEWRRWLKTLYEVDRSPAVRLIDATKAPLQGWTTYDQPRVRVWHNDRMVLLGDAAHATSPAAGQGASMAVEDAVVLAQCLRDLPVQQAFARYETVRRPRVEKVVAEGARMSKNKAAGPVGRTIRDLVMPTMMKREAAKGENRLRWVHQHHIDFGTPITAPVASARRSAAGLAPPWAWASGAAVGRRCAGRGRSAGDGPVPLTPRRRRSPRWGQLVSGRSLIQVRTEEAQGRPPGYH